MSTDEIASLHRRLETQEVILNEIRSAIVGNPAMGTPGLAARLKEVEDKANAIDKKLITWSGLVAGAVFGTKAIIDKLAGG